MNCAWTHRVLAVMVLLWLGSCASAVRYRTDTMTAPPDGTLKTGTRMRGMASYYHDEFHGRRTASGEIFQQHHLTAAHQTLPLGTLVRVVNLKNGRSVVVRINDRGPFVGGRILDVSRAAAEKLGMLADGLANVEMIILDLPP